MDQYFVKLGYIVYNVCFLVESYIE